MAWVWDISEQGKRWGAFMDYKLSAPFNGTESVSEVPVRKVGLPIYKSKTGLKKFQQLHCPPIGIEPTVDRHWRKIIQDFVPANRVQFLPIRLIARGEICDDFMWVIPFDRVHCIDIEHSDITQKLEQDGKMMLFRVRKFVHRENCLGKVHLAADERMPRHVLLSDELKSALAATGESSMFYQPEDLQTLDSMFQKSNNEKLN
jgi:hypothetical protein